MGEPFADASLSTLERVDGSATYSHNGYTIVAAVNGPIEVQRRDELPEEAVVDVVVRPAAGVRGVRERHLESIVQRTLRHVILVAAHPRTLIQIILQIIASQEDCFASNSLHQSASKIGVLPALLQTSVLALLSSSIPLTTVMTSTSIAVDREGTLYQNPSAAATQSAASLHVFGFSSIGDLLVAECEGSFPFDTWEKAFEVAKFRCRAEDTWPDVADEDVNMDSRQVSGLEKNLKVTIQKEVSQKQQWKKELD